MYALSLSLPPLFGWGSYGPEAGNVSCSVSWEIHDSSTNSESYIGFLFVIGLVLPVVVIVTSYFAIVTTTFRVKRKAGKNGIYGVNEGGGEGKGRPSSKFSIFFFVLFSHGFAGARGRREAKVTRMVALMISAFLIAWSPYAALALAAQYFNVSKFD